MTSHFLKTGTDVPQVRGGYNNGIRGRVNVRYNAKRDTYRFRFLSVHPDQAATILDALALARDESQTEYDTVALDGICLNYLSGPSVKRSYKPAEK